MQTSARMEPSGVPDRMGRPPLRFGLGPTLRKLTNHELFESFASSTGTGESSAPRRGRSSPRRRRGGRTGKRNFELTGIFRAWVEADGTGLGFDSSTGFILPNGAERSPDVAWVSRERWNALSDEEKEEFPPLCPDFVVELRSRSDSLAALRAKMREYVANGARLGWVIDPLERRVYVYRPPDEETCLEDPERVSGDPVLPGFVLDVRRVME